MEGFVYLPILPRTTTRSNRGFQLSPRVRVSKMVMRKPLRRLQCEQSAPDLAISTFSPV